MNSNIQSKESELQSKSKQLQDRNNYIQQLEDQLKQTTNNRLEENATGNQDEVAVITIEQQTAHNITFFHICFLHLLLNPCQPTHTRMKIPTPQLPKFDGRDRQQSGGCRSWHSSGSQTFLLCEPYHSNAPFLF